MNVRYLQVVVWLVGAVLAPAAMCIAEPQQAPQPDAPLPPQVRRPYRGLFGAPDLGRKQSLTLTGTLFAAYDDDLFASLLIVPGSPNPTRQEGFYGGATAGLNYIRNGRVFGSLGGEVGLRKYEQAELAPTYRASGDLGVTVKRRTTLSAAGTAVYAPQFRLGGFINPAVPGGMADPFQTVLGDYDLYDHAAYRTTVSLSAAHTLGRGSSLSGYYGLTNTDYVNGPYDYRSQTAGGLYIRPLTRHLGMRAGYWYSHSDYATLLNFTAPQGVHNIDIGVDYSRALSVSRRTRLAFSTGSSVVSTNPTPLLNSQRELRYRVGGTANLTHEMGRTWTASLAYRRGVDFREGFYDPFLTDGVSAGVQGLLSRRLRFTAAGDYSFGTVGFASSNHYSTGSASADLQFAFTRVLAAYAQYLVYHYSFDQHAALDPRLPQSLDRQGVRVGLMTSVPLIR